MKRLEWMGALLAALMSVAAIEAPPTSNESPQKPKTTTVTRGTLDLTIRATGTFAPVDPFEIRVRPKAYQGDLIIKSIVAPGASVVRGATILALDTDQIDRQVAAARNDQAQARANLTKAQADSEQGDAADALAMKMQEQEVVNAKSALKWWEDVDGRQLVQSAELGVQTVKDAIGDQEDELNELRKMYKSEELTSATADIVVKRAMRNLERTKINLSMTEGRARKVRENDYGVLRQRMTWTIEQQELALDRLRAAQAQSKVQRQGALTGAKLAMEAADKKLTDIDNDLKQFTINAPRDMTVFYGQFEKSEWKGVDPESMQPGEKITPDRVVATAFTPGRLRVVTDVPEGRLLLVSSGQKATVTPLAIPELVTEGSPQSLPAEPQAGAGGYRVIIDIASIDPRIVPGFKSNVAIAAPKLENLLLVPVSAVADGKVWVVGDGKETSADVLTGRSDGEMIEIVRGLSEGDEILTQG
ncbi:MAG: hypothetical protein ACREJC_20390, partial [Tepidisphaeraceae bacterium]